MDIEDAPPTTRTAPHPLDPLTQAEMLRAVAVLRAHYDWGGDLRVETIDLEEPAKAVVRAWKKGDALPRVARYHVYRHRTTGVHLGRIDLAAGRVYDEPCHRIMGRHDDLPNTEWVAKNHSCPPL